MRRILGLSAVFLMCLGMDLWIPQSPFGMPIVGFAPFICTLMGRSHKKSVFVMAIFCGIFHDLFTLQHRLGISAVGYLFAVSLSLVFIKRYYEEKLLPFFGVTFFISLCYSLFSIAFGLLKGMGLGINLKTLNSQLFVFPFFDALCGTFCVFIPLKVYDAIKRIITLKLRDE